MVLSAIGEHKGQLSHLLRGMFCEEGTYKMSSEGWERVANWGKKKRIWTVQTLLAMAQRNQTQCLWGTDRGWVGLEAKGELSWGWKCEQESAPQGPMTGTALCKVPSWQWNGRGEHPGTEGWLLAVCRRICGYVISGISQHALPTCYQKTKVKESQRNWWKTGASPRKPSG